MDVDHLPTWAELRSLPTFTPGSPMRILVSACLVGVPCGVDGTSYGGPYDHLARLFQLPNVRLIHFCPEDLAFGTPRATPDLHGGNGFDVLDGRARVLSDAGEDWTEPMLRSARAMVALARHHQVHLAVLMDISAACGSQVIYLGRRTDGRYQKGPGVCAALLERHGFSVVSQRDFRTLGFILNRLDPSSGPDPGARDHHETAWYVEQFGPTTTPR